MMIILLTLSLGRVGEVSNTLKSLKGVTDLSGNAAQINILSQSLSNLSKEDALKKIATWDIDSKLKAAAINSAEFAQEGTKLGATFTNTGRGIGNIFTGIGTAIKPLLPAVVAIGAGFAAFKVWDYSQHGFTRASEEAQTAASEYESAKNVLGSLNSQLETTQTRITQLKALQSTGTITFTEEAELEKLQKTNTELEAQASIQERLVALKQQASAQAAVTASTKSQSYTEAMEEKHGGFLGKIMGFFGGSEDGTYASNMTGEVKNVDSAASKWSKQYDGDTTLPGQVKGNIKLLKDYQDELVQIQKKLADPKNAGDETLIARQKELKSNIEETTATLAEQSTTLQSWVSQSVDDEGNAIGNSELQVRQWRTALTDISNIGKSKSEVDSNNLDNYFSSMGGGVMKDYLENIAKSSGNAEDALKAFSETGMSLKDINVSEDGFKRYFDNVIKSAKEANEAVNSVDGSVEGVTAAFKTANQDSDWNSMTSYLEQAKELYKQGKIGTDDFKSAAQFLSPKTIIPDGNGPDADAYVEAWTAAQEKLKRYFDSENPMASANNFKDDLASHGLGTKNGSQLDWTEKFKTSADAAKELGLSVEATEALMHNLESYGTEFGDIMWSGEGIKEYKSTLDEIHSLYDTMDEGDSKERLGELIEGWDEEYALAQQDLSNLTEEQVIKIKFEYEMAELQSEIDKLQNLVDQGDDSAQTYAALNAAKESYRDRREEDTGYDEEDSEGYARTSEFVDKLIKVSCRQHDYYNILLCTEYFYSNYNNSQKGLILLIVQTSRPLHYIRLECSSRIFFLKNLFSHPPNEGLFIIPKGGYYG